jgi:uncharacterized membrane protein
MVKKIQFAVLFALFVVLCSFTLVRADFSIQSQLETNTVCPSSTIIINEIISTTADASFSLSTSGSASQFTTAVPLGFFLSNGQTQSVFLYITPPSKTAPGVYNLILQVSSQGITKTVSHSIIVENCHKTVLVATPASQSSCTCEQKQVYIKISNQGKYLENYVLAAEGPLKQWVTFSGTSFSMPPNSTREAIAYFKTPCNVVGNYDTVFKVVSSSKYAQAETTAGLSLITCYDYSLNTEKTFYDLCETQTQVIPITLKNLGTSDNNYNVKLGSPSWMALDQKNIALSTDKEKIFNLNVQPPANTQGNFTAYIEVISDKGTVVKNLEINFNIGSCYGSTMDIDKTEDRVCNTLSNTYQVTITNTGKLSKEFDLVLDSPTWVTLDKSHISLNTGEKTTATLSVQPPQDTKSSSYPITIKSIDSISKKEAKASLNLTTLTTENCYQPSITSEKDSITVSQDSAATLLISIENKGLQQANYIIEISGTASGFSQINPAAISLDSKKTQSLYLYLSPSIETPVGEYILTISSRLKDSTLVAKKTIKVSVAKGEEIIIEPTNFTNQTNTTPEVEETSGTSGWTKFWSAIGNFFKNLFSSEEKKETIINANESDNAPPKLAKNFSNIEMESGGSYTIDLTPYFTDEDKDALQFITVKPLNISVLIRGSIMRLTAQEDFVGIRSITFYATDGNKMTASNTINITVIPKEVEELGGEETVDTNETQENETTPASTTPEPTVNITCNSYYWFDSNSTECDQKEFCGTYMYLGLQTFETLEECEENLPQISSNATEENETQDNESQIKVNQTLPIINQTTVNETTSCQNESTCSLNETNQTKPNIYSNATTNQTSQPSTPVKSNFWKDYQSYILLAILIAIIIILVVSGLGKKILNFFEEEPEKKK